MSEFFEFSYGWKEYIVAFMPVILCVLIFVVLQEQASLYTLGFREWAESNPGAFLAFVEFPFWMMLFTIFVMLPISFVLSSMVAKLVVLLSKKSEDGF